MQLIYYGDSLEHHGIKGQKWGVRRYQNADGSLTSAGRKRYDVGEEITSKYIRSNYRLSNGKKMSRKRAKTAAKELNEKRKDFDIESIKNSSESELKKNAEKRTKEFKKFNQDSKSGKLNKMNETEYFDKYYDLKDDSYRANMAYALKTGNFSDYINTTSLSKKPINSVKINSATKATVAICLTTLGGAAIAGLVKGLAGR